MPKPYDDGEIPTRWLWEDFKDEFRREVEKMKAAKEREREEAAIARKDRKERLKALQASIRLKLTKEELRAISFKK